MGEASDVCHWNMDEIHWRPRSILLCLIASPIGAQDLPSRGFSAATKIKQVEVRLTDERIGTWHESIRYCVSTSSYVWDCVFTVGDCRLQKSWQRTNYLPSVTGAVLPRCRAPGCLPLH